MVSLSLFGQVYLFLDLKVAFFVDGWLLSFFGDSLMNGDGIHEADQLLLYTLELRIEFLGLGGLLLIDLPQLLKVLQLVHNQLPLVVHIHIFGHVLARQSVLEELHVALLPPMVLELVEQNVEGAHLEGPVVHGHLQPVGRLVGELDDRVRVEELREFKRNGLVVRRHQVELRVVRVEARELDDPEDELGLPVPVF